MFLIAILNCYSEEEPGRAAAPPSPLLAVPNVTAHPSTASAPITVLLYDGPLLCSVNVARAKLSVTALSVLCLLPVNTPLARRRQISV